MKEDIKEGFYVIGEDYDELVNLIRSKYVSAIPFKSTELTIMRKIMERYLKMIQTDYYTSKFVLYFYDKDLFLKPIFFILTTSKTFSLDSHIIYDNYLDRMGEDNYIKSMIFNLIDELIPYPIGCEYIPKKSARYYSHKEKDDVIIYYDELKKIGYIETEFEAVYDGKVIKVFSTPDKNFKNKFYEGSDEKYNIILNRSLYSLLFPSILEETRSKFFIEGKYLDKLNPKPFKALRVK